MTQAEATEIKNTPEMKNSGWDSNWSRHRRENTGEPADAATGRVYMDQRETGCDETEPHHSQRRGTQGGRRSPLLRGQQHRGNQRHRNKLCPTDPHRKPTSAHPCVCYWSLSQERKAKKKKTFEEIRAENFPNLKKTISSQIQEAQHTPSRRTGRKLPVFDCAHRNQIAENQ